MPIKYFKKNINRKVKEHAKWLENKIRERGLDEE